MPDKPLILMIDDDPDFIDACRNFLGSAGYQVDYETEGRNGFPKTRTEQKNG